MKKLNEKVNKLKEMYRNACVGFYEKLHNDISGMAMWETLLIAVIGVVAAGWVIKAMNPTVDSLWSTITSKFSTLLS